MSYYIDNTQVCVECFYPHGHHAVSCKRQRMTGEQLYQLMQASIAAYLSDCPPRERHKYTGKLIHGFREVMHKTLPPPLWREFDAAMYAHGYHRRDE